MDPTLKVVTRLPLQELWRDDGSSICERGEALSAEEIAALLQRGRVQFVVAEVGTPLQWISPSECLEFWKADVKPHLAAAGSRASLERFPDGYCYFASRWNDQGSAPIIVLEKQH